MGGAYLTVEGLTTHKLVLRDMEAHIHIHVTDITAAMAIKDQCSTDDREIFTKNRDKDVEAQLEPRMLSLNNELLICLDYKNLNLFSSLEDRKENCSAH